MAFWNRKKQNPASAQPQYEAPAAQPDPWSQPAPAFNPGNSQAWSMADEENEKTVAPGVNDASAPNGWESMAPEGEETVTAASQPAAAPQTLSWNAMPAEGEETVTATPGMPMQNNRDAAPADSEETAAPGTPAQDGWNTAPADSEETTAPGLPAQNNWDAAPSDNEETTAPGAQAPDMVGFYDFSGDGEETITSGVVERRLRELKKEAEDTSWEDPMEKTTDAVMPTDNWAFGEDDLDKTRLDTAPVAGNGWTNDESETVRPANAPDLPTWGEDESGTVKPDSAPDSSDMFDDEGDLDKTMQAMPAAGQVKPAAENESTAPIWTDEQPTEPLKPEETVPVFVEEQPTVAPMDLSGYATVERLDALEQRISGLADDLGMVSGIAVSAKEEADQLEGYVTVAQLQALDTRVTELSTAVDAMKALMDDRMARLEERMQAMTMAQADLNGRLDTFVTAEEAAAAAQKAVDAATEGMKAAVTESLEAADAQL